MPLYDYRCRSCSNVTEVRHGFRETYDGSCPACGSDELARVFNPAGIVFKGSGFYVTDSRKKTSENGSPSSESKPAESKSAPASDSASSGSSSPSSTAGSSGSGGDSGPKKSEASAA
jgi:putative FmdB family regulatory protein